MAEEAMARWKAKRRLCSIPCRWTKCVQSMCTREILWSAASPGSQIRAIQVGFVESRKGAFRGTGGGKARGIESYQVLAWMAREVLVRLPRALFLHFIISSGKSLEDASEFLLVTPAWPHCSVGQQYLWDLLMLAHRKAFQH